MRVSNRVQSSTCRAGRRPHVLQTLVVRGCLLAVLAALPSVTRAQSERGVRETHPNLVGGEILGRGFVATFNYERFISNHFGLGAGFMGFASSGEFVSVLPLYASFVPGNVHSLYVAAGGAFVGGGETSDYESTFVYQLTVGYQYHSAGGLWVRPTFTYNKDSAENGGSTLIWPGIGIGGSF